MKNQRVGTHDEPHHRSTGGLLNKLRASVLGANDGIVSVAGLVVGVAGATSDTAILFAAGIAGILSGALSMAAGEYVSVSSQRDTERALLAKEKKELEEYPEEELEELTTLYELKGLSRKTAKQVASELTKRDAFAAHVDAELGINPNELISPWQAAIASAVSFTLGSLIPFFAILLPPEHVKVLATFIAVVIALSLTGLLSAQVGGANKTKATVRVIVGGILAMAITYLVGRLFSVAV